MNSLRRPSPLLKPLVATLLFGAALAASAATAPSTAPAPSAAVIEKQIADSQAQVNKSAGALGQSLTGNSELAGLLKQATDALSGGAAANYLTAFNKLSAAKLTPAQTKLAGELRDAAAALLLEKNISAANPAAANSVTAITGAIKSGNYTSALSGLTTLASDNKLTAPQKELVKSLLGQYAGVAKSAAGAVGQAASALKGLGLGGQ